MASHEAHSLLPLQRKPDLSTAGSETDINKRSGVKLDLSVTTIALFIVGKIAGVGIIALPKAIADTGIWGIALLFIYFGGSIYSGLILARNWNLVVERDPRLENEISRDPYPLMAYHAYGTPARRFAALVLYMSIIFGVTADILLVSENFQILFQQMNLNMPFCYWLPIVTYVVCPMTWLGTPKDFWIIGITAGLTSCLSSLFVIIGSSFDVTSRQDVDPLAKVDFWPFCSAFGLMAIAYSGQSVFPTLQHDMKRPDNFKKSVVIGYVSIVLCYVPSSLFAYWVYGADLQATQKDNVLEFFSSPLMVIVCIVSLNIHLLLSVIIDTNPLNQDIEAFIGIPYEFTWKRCISRTIIMTVPLLLSFLVPKFSNFISILGAPVTVFSNFLLPSLVHIKLRAMGSKVDERWISRSELAMHVVVNTLAAMGGVASIAAGVYNVTNSDSAGFTVPCFVNMTLVL